jgi:23S rRNA (uridine2552-2'-O)-methyltransferase
MTYRRKDVYHRRARAAGYRARSAYKLAELDERYRLLHRGDAVVDLGAWPGGWLQVAVERVGRDGIVVGVDTVAIEPLPASNVRLLTGDVRDPTTIGEAAALLGRFADVVLVDLAPKLTGIRDTDEAHVGELVAATLSALPVLLRPGGRILMKLFMGAGYDAAIGSLRASFADVMVTRPGATRQGSAELYAVAQGYRGESTR